MAKVDAHAQVLATLTALAVRWPKCFHLYEERRVPLKVGIRADIMAAGGFEEAVLRRALGAYCGNARYRSRLVAGAERIGLDGMPAGVVTPEHAAQRRRGQVRPSKSKGLVVPRNAGKLSSLADLREAAQRRKASEAVTHGGRQ